MATVTRVSDARRPRPNEARSSQKSGGLTLTQVSLARCRTDDVRRLRFSAPGSSKTKSSSPSSDTCSSAPTSLARLRSCRRVSSTDRPLAAATSAAVAVLPQSPTAFSSLGVGSSGSSEPRAASLIGAARDAAAFGESRTVAGRENDEDGRNARAGTAISSSASSWVGRMAAVVQGGACDASDGGLLLLRSPRSRHDEPKRRSRYICDIWRSGVRFVDTHGNRAVLVTCSKLRTKPSLSWRLASQLVSPSLS